MLVRSVKHAFRIVSLLLLLVALLLGGVWISLITLKVDVSLGGLRQPLQAFTQASFGRPLQVSGPITLVHSFNPTLELHDIRLPNRSLQPGTMLEIDQLIVEIDPWRLLFLNVEIQRLYADGVRLSLLRDAERRVNWDFGKEGATKSTADFGLTMDSEVTVDLGAVEIRDFTFRYTDIAANFEIDGYLGQLAGQALWDAPLSIAMQGALAGVPATLSLTGDAMQQLLKAEEYWEGLLKVDLGQVTLDVEVDFTPLRAQVTTPDRLGISLSSNTLADLTELFGSSYPDWGPWRVSGDIRYWKGIGYRLTEVRAELGDSHLQGELVLDLAENIPSWKAALAGGKIQMNDFPLLEYWTDEEESQAPVTDSKPVEIFGMNQEMLKGLDLRFTGKVGDVYAGEERLGAGQVDIGIGQGVFSITDLSIFSPEGELHADMGFRPARDKLYSRVAIVSRNFDYGPFLRRSDPEAENDGTFDARVDLVSESDGLVDFLTYADGEIAVTLWPRNYVTQELDMWAAGLISATIAQYGSDSRLNCVVARFDVESGLATDRAVMLDTSGMRVFGDGEIDFRDKLIDMYLIPKPKNRALLNLAIPVLVQGTFDEFEIGFKSEDVIRSYFRNTLRIWLSGIPLLFQETIDPDGSQICRLAMETDIDIRRPPGDLDQYEAENL